MYKIIKACIYLQQDVPEPENDSYPASNATEVQPRKKRKCSTPLVRELDNELLSEATNTMREMSSLFSRQQELPYEVFGKYVASELRDMTNAGYQSVALRAKRAVQQAIMDAWDSINDVGTSNAPYILQQAMENSEIFGNGTTD